MSFEIIRAGISYCVVLVVTPANSKEGEGTYYEYNPGRRVPGWKSDQFNEVSWERDAKYLFSGHADGMGFAEIPDKPFPTLDSVLEFIKSSKKKIYIQL